MGGAERLIIDLVSNFNQDLFEIKVICLKRFGTWGLELKNKGVPLILLGQKRGISFFSLIKLISILKKEKPDIAHTHLFGADVYGSLAARLAGVKYLVSTEHNLNYNEGFIKNIVKIFVGKLFNNIIAVSDAVKNHIIKVNYIKIKKILVIYNGVDVNKFYQFHDGLNSIKNNQKIIIGSIGRLTKQKGFEYLIEAVAKLSGRNIECLIAGDGELKTQLQEKVKKFNLENKIKFLGWQKDIKSFLAKIDIFILPSLWEGFGIAILEAGSAGLPVIASNVDGIKEIIEDNKDGLLIKPADSAELAKKIEYLFGHREFGAELAASLRTKIKNNFTIEKIAAEYEKLYLNLYNHENFAD